MLPRSLYNFVIFSSKGASDFEENHQNSSFTPTLALRFDMPTLAEYSFFLFVLFLSLFEAQKVTKNAFAIRRQFRQPTD
jgi:hypothetical protein